MVRKYVQAGDWRTLVSLWNTTATGVFRAPAGAEIKVRYGVGWLGKDRQKQKLDGFTPKILSVGRWSATYSRMQIKVQESMYVDFDYFPGVAGEDLPSGVGTLP